jgi:hypothetical protein
MMSIPAWNIFPILAVTFLLTACASDPIPPPVVGFDVTADSQTNNNRLFYFVVRTANEKQFMLESYEDVASKAFSDPPDPGVLGVFSVVPGTTQNYSVNQPAQGTIALYFLFTDPGLQWKKLLGIPLEEKYNIDLKENSQVNIKENKGWFSWF